MYQEQFEGEYIGLLVQKTGRTMRKYRINWMGSRLM